MRAYHTRSRDSIIAYLKNHPEYSYSAQEVCACFEENGQKMNLATVYRNLDRLAAEGLLLKFKSADDEAGKYQYSRPGRRCEEHIHMQCRECGRLFHLECAFMEEIAGHLKEHHSFSLESPGSLLKGLCKDCGGGKKTGY